VDGMLHVSNLTCLLISAFRKRMELQLVARLSVGQAKTNKSRPVVKGGCWKETRKSVSDLNKT